MFQSVVNNQIGFGVPGELAYEGPLRAQPAILVTANPALNVIGCACSVVAGATGSWVQGDAGKLDPRPLTAEAGGDGPFAGILGNPKVYPLYGTPGSPFGSTMTLPNGIAVELITEGDVVVVLPPCTAGDWVYYLQANGALTTTGPGGVRPAASVGPIGTVERFVNTVTPSLGVVHLISESALRAVNA